MYGVKLFTGLGSLCSGFVSFGVGMHAADQAVHKNLPSVHMVQERADIVNAYCATFHTTVGHVHAMYMPVACIARYAVCCCRHSAHAPRFFKYPVVLLLNRM
jgi:hypothetical protein